MKKNPAFYFIAVLFVIGTLLFAGCNPTSSTSTEGAGNPEQLKIAGYEKNGAPRLEKTKTPSVIMFTGDF